ncbi:MAG: CYTH domain-containing protein [Candidatus Paceibacterota bacterium]
MQSYEVEVKALLGSAQRAQELRDALKSIDPNTQILSHNRQLNHYFEGGTLEKLCDVMVVHLSEHTLEKLRDFAKRAKKFSVRTRDKDNIVLLVIKASVGDDTSENGVTRMELEEHLPFTINELDDLVLEAGFTYQAKWSREREEYLVDGINVCLDKNAGYGYLAEFEIVVDDAAQLGSARVKIDEFMRKVGTVELPQDRLERMFSFYNAHWPEYYGTDKIFTIE